MSSPPLDVVTGAFSYTGRAIAQRLGKEGRRVRTLSRALAADDSPIEWAPLQFADPAALTRSLEGADTLYNTYWIRFPRGESTFERAVENTRTLLAAAREAGVRRFVHVSVSNPSEDSPLGYYRGKAETERAVRESGLSHAIVRPTLVFGTEDVLINNIAWILRRLPLFVLPGGAAARVQPVAIEDVAELCVAAGQRDDNETLDAAGPETLPFAELVGVVREAIGTRSRIVRLPPRIALGLSRAIGLAVRDVVLTREELAGLQADLLVSAEPPRGERTFRRWVVDNGALLGRSYVSELERNYRHASL
jgi:uncharacterized protein YbjT (DUF2867 family)